MLFLVMGIEGSGTRLTTRLVMSMGVEGSDTHTQPLDDILINPNRNVFLEYATKNNIIIRRSIPHADKIPNFDNITNGIEKITFPILTSRDTAMTIESLIGRKRVQNHDEALARIRLGQKHMAKFLSNWDGPFAMVSYSGFIYHSEAAIKCLYYQLKNFCPSLHYPTYKDIKPEAEQNRAKSFLERFL